MSALVPDLDGRSISSWSDIPTEWLHIEIQKRQDAPSKPACGSGKKGAYNVSLHVFALFLILVLSTLACSFPIIVRRFPRLPVPHHFLFLSRHFGSGVLIATAFVHLLPTAFVSLTDPCLPQFWNKGYPAMAGLIAMTATLVVVGIEMFFATRGAGHIHGSEYDAAPEEEGVHASHNGDLHHKRHRSESMRRFQSGASGKDFTGSGRTSMERLINEDTPSMTSGEPSPSMANGTTYHDEEHNDDDRDSNEDLDLDELDPASGSSTLLASTASRKRASSYSHQASSAAPPNNHHHGPLDPNSPLAQKKLLLQCLLLEAGILFHSVFIGIALSVATGTPFVVLLVAISFHQTFEGLALGSRIAAITSFAPSSPKPWLMALAYGTTTPVGQAIGLGVQGLYDPKGVMGLLMVGVMNAVSSGLLLFAGLVELLAEDFLSERSYETLRGRRRLQACASVVAGAGLMAFVGAWA